MYSKVVGLLNEIIGILSTKVIVSRTMVIYSVNWFRLLIIMKLNTILK
jgi:hypothetical protein